MRHEQPGVLEGQARWKAGVIARALPPDPPYIDVHPSPLCNRRKVTAPRTTRTRMMVASCSTPAGVSITDDGSRILDTPEAGMLIEGDLARALSNAACATADAWRSVPVALDRCT